LVSIIICSRNTDALLAVRQNISATIGVPHEVIAIDNSQKKYGICEAYNIGAAQANYSFLCFMHEDIKFHALNWGNTLVDILSNAEIGVLGVAGGTYQPKAPSGWGAAGLGYLGINVIHHIDNGRTRHDYSNPKIDGDKLLKATTLDGLWLCCRKSVWQEFKFDAIEFPGFHFYDIDFCTRVATRYTNYITFDILIEHFSHGTFDNAWLENAIHYYKKRNKYLPFSPEKLTRTVQSSLDLIVWQSFTLRVIQNKLPKKDALFCLLECLKLNPLNRDNLYLLKRYLAM
jgi:hypothetical protein